MRFANGTVTLSPSGEDDTSNLQCAFDEAVSRNLPRVRLSQGEFFVSSVEVVNFTGTFQGAGREQSSIKWLRDSIDCKPLFDSGDFAAMLRFRLGRPTVQYMTIISDEACRGEAFFGRVVIAASGSRFPQCRPENVNLTVDRVSFNNAAQEGRERQSAPPAVLVASQSNCSVLTGSLSIRQSSVDGMGAISSALERNSPVDIRFNTFTNFFRAINVGNRSQDVNIVDNVFRMRAFPDGTGSVTPNRAVAVSVSDIPRNSEDTRQTIRIAQNEFFALNAGGAIRISGVDNFRYPDTDRRSYVITDNAYEAEVTRPFGEDKVWFLSVSGAANGHVSGNQVSGDTAWAISASDNPGRPGRELRNWTVLYNDFGGKAVYWNYRVRPIGPDSFIGPDQNALLCTEQTAVCDSLR